MTRGWWVTLPEISEAMDGRREAHMDVLVAVSGRVTRQPRAPKARDHVI